MLIQRKLVQIDTPQGQPGFLGAGHIARPVVWNNFRETDPFIFLMDDHLDKKDNNPVGGPHPHAGFETVSLLLEGTIGDDLHQMKAGDLQLMTAGSGVVHTETISERTKMRLLQLWLNLPKQDRWATPRVQDLSFDHVPFSHKDGVLVRLYSGRLAGLQSPILNHTPLIIADITLDNNITTSFELPANFNTFLYVLEGSLQVGEEHTSLNKDQVGWLDKSENDNPSELSLTAGSTGARFVLYAGKPTGDTIVSHGPFIGDSTEDIQRLYQDYRLGKMKHINSVPEEQQIRI